MKTEAEIRERIHELENLLRRNEILHREMPAFRQRILLESFNIESQLYALYYVLGEEYEYKHK